MSKERPEVSDELFVALQNIIRSWENAYAGPSLDQAKQMMFAVLKRHGWMRAPRG